ncbi:hypothetical protein BaRGS_00021437, partial [Batillaria attramentaria]
MSCCAPDSTRRHTEAETQDVVKQYYGKELKTSKDCQTGVNCLIDTSLPKHIRQALSEVHDEVTSRYYGCGRVIPEALEGCSVLDLGCGSGRDCYAVSKLVGPSGRVVGIDMTEEQLAVARKYVDYHTEKFGYSQPAVQFLFGYIEKLQEAGLQDETFDVVISNCVVNLSTNKPAVLKEVHRVLKEGGEFYFSDVYTNTTLTEEIKTNSVLWGECIAGALHWRQLHQLAEELGFCQPRLVTSKMVNTSKFTEILGDAKFVSVTYRMFKLPKTLRPASSVTYKGGITGCEDQFEFDRHFTFKKGEEVAMDQELATILAISRFSDSFTIKEATGKGHPESPASES